MTLTPIAYTQIPRLDKSLISRASKSTVADLHEGLGAIASRQGLMHTGMRPVWTGAKICGQAVTSYNYPGDNLLLHVAAKLAEPGDVIVATNGGSAQGALWGDMITYYAQKKGIAGAVIDGAARDTGKLREMAFPVFSTAIAVSHPEKRGPGSVNVPMVVAGVTVNPGDLIVADDDGVLVIPPELVAPAVENAEARAAKEEAFRSKLDDGSSMYELLGLQKDVEACGLQMVENTWRDAQ
ncbi:4-carboxy-4-hydroxy-2-oxoadipate aldolase/oxaloacetate decarboxylase [Arenibacterium halophilum]|uniref:Putative 4-hydroxy-4-methyl-2-oxoglutarate aldolase n=1 Tax=Arenibacterium halophilum TaxID=2583821 RepID=A0ABY2X0K5_9RHOB|nr:4-carboxy-4-hydroxy-2-oxoadipate aldolase/oxaloacetate decarboxylase [Arenibacterium halophilum]TMV08375.1 4-carboxy-4-hydroxy-2-oxoadipate aldolase/oxaloacetate decarboxylase [Arenibacterium halophilum]